jgi:hypothetical protein
MAEQQAVLLRLVSISEAFVDTLQIELLSEKVIPNTQTLTKLVAAAEVESSRNWPARDKAFKSYHSIALNKLDCWKELIAATHVRNSIAHALGALTAKQRGNSNLPTDVKLIDAEVAGGRMHISEMTLSTVTDVCRKFILSLDGAC